MVVLADYAWPTQYEVVAESQAQRYLVGYAPRTWTGLVGTLRRSARAFTRVTQTDTLSRTETHAAATDTGWVVTFSGRTQRQAQQGGELPRLAQQ